MAPPLGYLQTKVASLNTGLLHPDSPIRVLLAIGVAVIFEKSDTTPPWLGFVPKRVVIVLCYANAWNHVSEQLGSVWAKLSATGNVASNKS